MEIFTIGYAGRKAEEFFGMLQAQRIERLVDVRLRNTSQLLGYTKGDDLAYFLRRLCSIEYVHEPLLAPTAELLDGYRKKEVDWEEYKVRFMQLMEERQAAHIVEPLVSERRTVLMCSENLPEQCHRSLIVEYMANHDNGLIAIHLVGECNEDARNAFDSLRES